MKPPQGRLIASENELAWITAKVLQELRRAEGKFPLWPKDLIHGGSIVAEEAGELVKAANQFVYEEGDLFEVLEEAVQTAATSFRILVVLRREFEEIAGEPAP
jgi:hypothetical protein